MSESIRLGSFDVLGLLGKGGMAEVWRGRHILQDVPVAIKFVTTEKTFKSRKPGAMLEEIRAVARLEHRAVIQVFDCGTVPPEIEEFTDGRVPLGSSYLVMELAESSLSRIDRSTLDWPSQRRILLEVLEALAHSHSRGVIHRDIKPDNVLLVSTKEGPPRIKLTDFGLAHAYNEIERRDVQDKHIIGTPSYMAPEQIRGYWRDQGPWTDLYAVGCLAYWLAGGRAPFEGQRYQRILKEQLRRRPDPLRPRVQMPANFQKWLNRLMAKDPSDRYRQAADAICDLLDLEGMGDETSASLPGSWRMEDEPASMELIGAGLGLFGLRKTPLVGREKERDQIWNTLREVEREGKPRGVVLRGACGTGTSRLAEWIAERAQESGGLTVLKARHSLIGGAADGVARMFANYLSCTGLHRRQIAERLQTLTSHFGLREELGSYECDVLTEMLTPAADPEYQEDRIRFRFSDPREGQVVAERLLLYLTERRPVVLVLDDVQWGPDTLMLVERLLRRAKGMRLPLLLLMTVQENAEGVEPVTRLQLQGIEERENVETLAIGALSEREHATLVKQIIGFESGLAEEVSRRTAGNPLFAVQLVGDWVERRLLEVKPQGFSLRSGSGSVLPDDIHHLLIRRIDQVLEGLAGRREEGQAALELAAALGDDVEDREWTRVCATVSEDLFQRILEAMAARDLIQIEPNGWNLVHGALRESLERLAREGGRWKDHNRLCAQMLQELYGTGESEISARQAHHFLEAGDLQSSLDPLLKAATYYGRTARWVRAHEYFDRYEDGLTNLGVSNEDRRRTEGHLKRAVIYVREEKFEEERALLAGVREVLSRNDWPELSAEWDYQMGVGMQLSGDIAGSTEFGKRALEKFQDLGSVSGIARSCYLLGEAASWSGERERARPIYERAEELFVKLGDRRNSAKCRLALGYLHARAQRTEQGIAMIREAIDEFLSVGDTYAVGIGYSNLGEVYRELGELEQARRIYEVGRETFSRAGISELSLSLNLCITLQELGEYGSAQEMLEELLPAVVASARRAFIGVIHATMLSGFAVELDWERWDESLQLAKEFLEGSELVDVDLAETFQRAGSLALDAGQVDRAQKGFLRAIELWRALERDDRIAEIEGVLEPMREN